MQVVLGAPLSLCSAKYRQAAYFVWPLIRFLVLHSGPLGQIKKDTKRNEWRHHGFPDLETSTLALCSSKSSTDKYAAVDTSIEGNCMHVLSRVGTVVKEKRYPHRGKPYKWVLFEAVAFDPPISLGGVPMQVCLMNTSSEPALHAVVAEIRRRLLMFALDWPGSGSKLTRFVLSFSFSCSLSLSFSLLQLC